MLTLKNEVADMAQIAQNGFLQAWKAFQAGSVKQAKEVVVRDEKLNVLAARIFKMGLSLIARQAPVAKDLRTIGAYLKVVTDLERIGDLSGDIANVVVRLEGKPQKVPLFEIPDMAASVQEILSLSVRALKMGDTRQLRSLDDMDDVIDAYYSRCFIYLERSMESESDYVQEGVQLFKVIQALERIGDHATNIGEWTLYMSTGNIADLNT
ncbi:phosphate signaling complex protein PhoU [Aneurinibacillus uraniidurans]|uniref:phosphate signaling complex protein PhoU n=1 Tax=Aneurinibacillus uraniidurans TaxID=2966586 RepID=UPI00234A8E2A|nr:phosphate signaling complex protein PhoU [Aneurinibacillus sp. B1]WCN37723.1 phosphate signaling complex protein PhoU [Aneurinibacillus sp. B1]